MQTLFQTDTHTRKVKCSMGGFLTTWSLYLYVVHASVLRKYQCIDHFDQLCDATIITLSLGGSVNFMYTWINE